MDITQQTKQYHHTAIVYFLNDLRLHTNVRELHEQQSNAHIHNQHHYKHNCACQGGILPVDCNVEASGKRGKKIITPV